MFPTLEIQRLPQSGLPLFPQEAARECSIYPSLFLPLVFVQHGLIAHRLPELIGFLWLAILTRSIGSFPETQ
jgi:hypothetical protein